MAEATSPAAKASTSGTAVTPGTPAASQERQRRDVGDVTVTPVPASTSARAVVPSRSAAQESSRFAIGTPGEASPTPSPWWAEAREVDGEARKASAIPESLRPVFEELQAALCREVRETRHALMEQNFRLHAQLGRDVEDLREEVQALRGELRMREER